MDQDQDETIVVSRTTPLVEEATIITSANSAGVEEATITNPTFSNSDHTITGPSSFGLVEDSEPVGLIPELAEPVAEVPDLDVEETFEREVGQVYEAPALVPTKAIPLPVVDLENRFDIAPEVVSKSKPTSADASKLFKKNINRTKRNSLGVILVVIAGALLIGVTLAILWAKFS